MGLCPIGLVPSRAQDQWHATKDYASRFYICVAKSAGEISIRISALLAYLRGIPDGIFPSLLSQHISLLNSPVEQLALKYRCLLCPDKRSFGKRAGLLKHYLGKHIPDGVFNHPFPCPECICTISSAEGWSNHVERYYGRDHAPSLHNLALSISPAICCFAYNKKHAP